MQIKTMRYYLLQGPQSGTLTTPNADKDMEQQEHSRIAGGMQIGTANFEDSSAVS